MTESLVNGQRIEIRGFGSFTVTTRAARMGRNPRSGETVHVPAKRVPHFKAGKELRERVDATFLEIGRASSRERRYSRAPGWPCRTDGTRTRTASTQWRYT